MCTNFEIASVIFEICIVREPATTPGPPLLLARDTGNKNIRHVDQGPVCGALTKFT